MRVIVTTHDANAHIIPLFIQHFERVWPDCPHWVDLVGCTKMPEVASNYHVTLLGLDQSWSSNMLKFLGATTEPFLLLLEDFLLESIEWDAFNEALAAISRPSVGQVRLRPCPGPTLPYSENLGRIDKSAPYALSLQAALWRPQVFRDLLIPGENPWQVETRGARRAKNYREYDFLGTWNWTVKYREFVRRGKLIGSTVNWLTDNGVDITDYADWEIRTDL